MWRRTNRETGTVMDEYCGALAVLFHTDTDKGFDEAQRKLNGIRPKLHKYINGLTQQQRDGILATWPSVLNTKMGLTRDGIHFIENPNWLTLLREVETV